MDKHLSIGFFLLAVVGLQAEERVDFNRDIRPILAENCFACHGFDEKAREADLRLDRAEDAYADRDGVTPIKPGELEQSAVWQRIMSDNDDEKMPPPQSQLKLTDADKAKIKAWIQHGAKYAGHWSFIPPQRPPVPPGDESAIDALVRQRLKNEGLEPSSAADRHMLIRRIYFDLTGLPPSAEEVEAFVADGDPNAYAKLVEWLLQSPHYGERMALDWLDAARYADTNGFSIDGGRHMWLWRDWVIQAFNDNKPYDRFLLEQLAGDLLPEHSEAELIATGFQRNNMVTHEGGTIPEENLTNYNADRVRTLGESILGLTLGCVQCHDHKFDPITQRDYYQLFAYFNSLGDKGLDGNAGINPAPYTQARTVLKTDEVPKLRKQIEELQQKLKTPDAAALARWEQRAQARLAERGKDFQVHPVEVLKVSTPNRGAGFDMEGTSGVRLRQPGDLGAFDISTRMPQLNQPVTGIRVSMLPVPDLPGGGWGGGPALPRGRARKAKAAENAKEPPQKGTFVLTAISVTADAIPGDQVDLNNLESIVRTTASSWDPQYPPADCLDPRNDSGWSPDLAAEGPVHLTATLAQPLDTARTPYLTVQLNFGHGKSLIAGHMELAVITGTDDGSDLPPDIISILQAQPAERSSDQQASLWRYCAEHGDELAADRVALANLEERLSVLTQAYPTMVMDSTEKPRDTYILRRGDYTQPMEKVTPGTIASLPPPPADAIADRLGLARWVTMRSNPLTARVAVNRFWKMCFGVGIVATPADFGAQGEWPSHPDVLDWLAVEFMDSGWDVKHIIRLIVTSKTYRQTSVASAELLERDPQNRLLARGPRFRLPAEFVRDAALKVSGLLVPRIGGPSVNPYTPGDLWREVSHYGSTPATAQTFVQDHGEKLYRRSLYTYWKRTAPPPSMVAFDAPNREVCTVSRASTTTPLQALVTLNDPQFVEAARAFAQRILARGGGDSEKLRWALTEAISRPPTPEESRVLLTALARERRRYADNPAAAAALLSVGESPRDTGLAPSEHAAWTQIATVVFNLSESITRN